LSCDCSREDRCGGDARASRQTREAKVSREAEAPREAQEAARNCKSWAHASSQIVNDRVRPNDPVALRSQEYYRASTEMLSSLVRQLAFAGIAIVWLFSDTQNLRAVSIPDDLTRAAILIVAALSCDFMQYVYRSAAWGIVNRRRELGKLVEREAGPFPAWINWPSLGCFWAKVLLLVAAYVQLFIALWDDLS
jgi:hypothetical protein